MSTPPSNMWGLAQSRISQGLALQSAQSPGNVLLSNGNSGAQWTTQPPQYVPRFKPTNQRLETGDVVRVLYAGVYDGTFELSKGDVGTVHTSTDNVVSVTFWRHPDKLMMFEPHTLEKFEP